MKALKFNSGRLIYFLMYKNENIYKLYRAQDLFWKKQITKIKNMFFTFLEDFVHMYTFL